MADISAEITAFKNAAYGEDVRDAMVSLANKLNANISNISAAVEVNNGWTLYSKEFKDVYGKIDSYEFYEPIDTYENTYNVFNNEAHEVYTLAGCTSYKFDISDIPTNTWIYIHVIKDPTWSAGLVTDASDQPIRGIGSGNSSYLSTYFGVADNSKYLYINCSGFCLVYTLPVNHTVNAYEYVDSISNTLSAAIERLAELNDLYVAMIPDSIHMNGYASFASQTNQVAVYNKEGSTCLEYNVEGGVVYTISNTPYDTAPWNTQVLFADSDGFRISGIQSDNPLVEYMVIVPENAVKLYINTRAPNDTIVARSASSHDDSPSSDSRFANKSMVCFGDSITWYDGHEYNWGKEAGEIATGYESYLRELGLFVNNQGSSGSTLASIYSSKIQPFNFSGYDYCTLTSGANDSRHKIPIGEIQEGPSFDNTFIGRLQQSIETILTRNSTIELILITPIRGWIYAPDGYASDPKPDVDGVVDEAYADAIRLVGDYYDLPVCDWYDQCGINIFTREWFMNDPEPPGNKLYSLHPSTEGYKRMARILIDFMNRIK